MPLQVPTPPAQAALLACNECDTVRSIQPHGRGDTKLKQQKNVNPKHYVRHFFFVTNYYYLNRFDRLCKHQHGGHFQHSVTITLTYTSVLISTSSPPYSDCLIPYILPTVHARVPPCALQVSMHLAISLLQ